VSCHSGANPAAELSLAATYSATANYPKGRWATTPGLFNPEYLSTVPAASRVPGYDWSVNYNWYFRDLADDYRLEPFYKTRIENYAPLAALARWDPGYQNLHAKTADGSLIYLNSSIYYTHLGRGDTLGGNARTSYLMEVLTGEDADPNRSYTGPSHVGMLDSQEVELFRAVLDAGFPYTSRCDYATVPEGPNAGMAWGDISVTPPG